MQCNGQSISQSVYAALYGVIGQNYLRYMMTVGSALSGIVSNRNQIIFDGTDWVMWSQAATTSPKSTSLYSSDGLAWSAGGSSAVFTATQSGTSLVVSAVASGFLFVGMGIAVPGYAASGYITAFVSGVNGGAGTYTVTSMTQTVSVGQTMYGLGVFAGNLFSDGAGNVLSWISNYAGALFSSNHGVTWTYVALPSAAGWVFAVNGTHWLGVRSGSTDVISCTVTGGVMGAWTSNAGVLPVAPNNGQISGFWWDGAQWNLVSQSPSTANLHQYSTVAAGTSGWADTVIVTAGAVNNTFLVIPGSTNVLTDYAAYLGLQYSTNSGASFGVPGFMLGTQTTNVIWTWNGLHWILVSQNVASIRLMTPTGSYASPLEALVAGSSTYPYVDGSFITTMGQLGAGSFYQIDTTNHRYVFIGQQDTANTGTAVIATYTVDPSINVATNFLVPDAALLANPSSSIISTKAWVRAL